MAKGGQSVLGGLAPRSGGAGSRGISAESVFKLCAWGMCFSVGIVSMAWKLFLNHREASDGSVRSIPATFSDWPSRSWPSHSVVVIFLSILG